MSRFENSYRGRLAPSPTGHLHLGHARTFWVAQERALAHGGTLVLRNEDLDSSRSRPEFVSAMIGDLQWFGFKWQEGPDRGGPFTPYNQSERILFYRAALGKLLADGFVYPCTCSRKDIQQAVAAPHPEENEPVYPGTCRPKGDQWQLAGNVGPASAVLSPDTRFLSRYNWRFRVPDGETISFVDGNFGRQQFVAGQDFGDFIVWQYDNAPAYQLACVVDDAAMQITEVVRGADLLISTARQILLYHALGLNRPAFYHCSLLRDKAGERLAKRHESLSLQTLRISGETQTRCARSTFNTSLPKFP